MGRSFKNLENGCCYRSKSKDLKGDNLIGFWPKGGTEN